MTKSEDISRLDRVLKDAEIRIQTALTNVEALTREIDTLLNEEKALEDNVKCLKKNRIIAIAQEFKRAKFELDKVRNRRTLLCNDRESFLKSTEDMKSFIAKTKKELDKLQATDNSNVLQFTRGNKDEP